MVQASLLGPQALTSQCGLHGAHVGRGRGAEQGTRGLTPQTNSSHWPHGSHFVDGDGEGGRTGAGHPIGGLTFPKTASSHCPHGSHFVDGGGVEGERTGAEHPICGLTFPQTASFNLPHGSQDKG